MSFINDAYVSGENLIIEYDPDKLELEYENRQASKIIKELQYEKSKENLTPEILSKIQKEVDEINNKQEDEVREKTLEELAQETKWANDFPQKLFNNTEAKEELLTSNDIRYILLQQSGQMSPELWQWYNDNCEIYPSGTEEKQRASDEMIERIYNAAVMDKQKLVQTNKVEEVKVPKDIHTIYSEQTQNTHGFRINNFKNICNARRRHR